jgi:hypothetical protein
VQKPIVYQFGKRLGWTLGKLSKDFKGKPKEELKIQRGGGGWREARIGKESI